MILLKLTLLLKGTFLSCYFFDFFSCRKCWVWLCLKIIDLFQILQVKIICELFCKKRSSGRVRI